MRKTTILLFTLFLAGCLHAAREAANDSNQWLSQVKSLCVQVEQSYPEIGEHFRLPIAPWTRGVLSGAGYTIMPSVDSCDAELTITLKGKPLSRSYAVIGGGGTQVCYWGAEVHGRITLTGPGRPVEEFPIDEVKQPPSGVSFCPDTPERAPFERVWPHGVLEILYELWGEKILVSALAHDEYWVNLAAVDLLEEKRGIDAVPLLIEALEHKNANVRHYAARALKNVTGEDFGEDASRWQEWWAYRERNK